jgi:hypothetical protein
MKSENMTEAEIYALIVENLPKLERRACNLARVDSRLDPQDLLNDAIADMVYARTQFDPQKGAFRVWAYARLWKARTYALRVANRHAPRERGSFVGDEGETIDTPVDRGSFGDDERSVAFVEAQCLYDAATEEERELLNCVALGLKPSVLGLKKGQLEKKLRSFAQRVGVLPGLASSSHDEAEEQERQIGFGF